MLYCWPFVTSTAHHPFLVRGAAFVVANVVGQTAGKDKSNELKQNRACIYLASLVAPEFQVRNDLEQAVTSIAAIISPANLMMSAFLPQNSTKASLQPRLKTVS